MSSHSCFPKENSVNSHFAPEFSAVSFEVHDHCIRIMLELGQGCLVTYWMLSGSFPFPSTIACCSSLRGNSILTRVCRLAAALRVRRLSRCHKQCSGYVYIRQIFHISVTLSMTLSFSRIPIHSVSSIWTDSFNLPYD